MAKEEKKKTYEYLPMWIKLRYEYGFATQGELDKFEELAKKVLKGIKPESLQRAISEGCKRGCQAACKKTAKEGCDFVCMGTCLSACQDTCKTTCTAPRVSGR